jgi:NADH-ubiquinone oxidoreductase chain 6
MLINVRVSELVSDTSNSIPLALITAVSFNFPVSQILPLNLLSFDSYNVNSSYFDFIGRFFSFFSSKNEIMFVTSKL